MYFPDNYPIYSLNTHTNNLVVQLSSFFGGGGGHGSSPGSWIYQALSPLPSSQLYLSYRLVNVIVSMRYRQCTFSSLVGRTIGFWLSFYQSGV